MNQYRLANRVLATSTFAIAFFTYVLTLQPSVPFWDTGEFSAAIAWQQVPHPPGAPLWLIFGKVFHLLPFGDPGWRINLASGMLGAVASMLVYLTMVMVIERWHPYRSDRPMTSHLTVFGGSVIAALTFTWSDSQWFNSVESEVYAPGSMLIALLVYLMMRWDREAERPGHERYLLGIAYVLGLAIGVHLLALLVVPGVAMTIFYRRYRENWLKFLIMTAITGVAFYFLIYQAPLKYIPSMLAATSVGGAILLLAVVGLAWWAHRERKAVVYLSAMSMLLIVLGYTTYTHVLIRANSHPPMNENEPDTFAELVDYLGRTQYGDAPLWPRRYSSDPAKRQYQDRYDEGTDGKWQPPVSTDEDESPVFEQVNTSGELNFMWQYQIRHMYIRYFLWNFVGRVSDRQDAPPVWFNESPEDRQQFIAETGYEDYFPVTFYALPLLLGLFGLYYHYKRDWKMAFTYTALFLLMGVIATLQQNQQQPQPRERDYFYTGSFMIWAMWVGIGATGLAELVQRKRSGSTETSERSGDHVEGGSVGIAGGILALCLLAAPLNMAMNGWRLHDRSGNWVPWDYAYNILQSCAKDAILFTNGDNDTFPLWYLQDVAGVRRDVRVVNLSLGNTLWYVWQLKNEQPWGAKKVPLSFPDNSLIAPDGTTSDLRPRFMAPPTVTVPVPATVMSWATDGAVKKPGTMAWVLRGEPFGGGTEQMITVSHQLVRDIVQTNQWKRPIYFGSWLGASAWAGLEEFFRREGMVYRLMPVRQSAGGALEAMDVKMMRASLLGPVAGDVYDTLPRLGMRFRNLDDPSVFYLEEHRRVIPLYRTMYMTLAEHEISKAANRKGAVAALDTMEHRLPHDVVPLPYWMAAGVSMLYKEAGVPEKSRAWAKRAVEAVDDMGESWMQHPYARAYHPIQTKAEMLANMGRHDDAIAAYKRMQAGYPNDPNIRAQIEELEVERHLSGGDTAAAVRELERIIDGYRGASDRTLLGNVSAYRTQLVELRGEAVAPPDRAGADSSTSSRKR